MAPHIDVGIRIQCLVYLEFGLHVDEIEKILGVHPSSIYRYRRTAIARGYNPAKSRQILLSYLQDAPKPGRPTVCTLEVVNQVITNAISTAEGRQSNATIQ